VVEVVVVVVVVMVEVVMVEVVTPRKGFMRSLYMAS